MTDITFAIHLDRFVRRLHGALTRRAKDFDKDRVGPGGAMLLLTLDELGTVPLSTLSERLVRDKSQLTREIASLERKGMVSRAPCPVDARSSLMSLTENGAALVSRHQVAVAATLDEMLGDLSQEERQKFKDILAKAQDDA